MTPVAIYLRVSTASQTIEDQRLELHRYCDAHGWEIVRGYADEGISGTAPRPALQPPEQTPVDRLRTVAGMSLRAGAAHLQVPKSTLQRWRSVDSKSGVPTR